MKNDDHENHLPTIFFFGVSSHSHLQLPVGNSRVPSLNSSLFAGCCGTLSGDALKEDGSGAMGVKAKNTTRRIEHSH